MKTNLQHFNEIVDGLIEAGYNEGDALLKAQSDNPALYNTVIAQANEQQGQNPQPEHKARKAFFAEVDKLVEDGYKQEEATLRAQSDFPDLYQRMVNEANG